MIMAYVVMPMFEFTGVELFDDGLISSLSNSGQDLVR